jgi:hypothetical protein
MGKSKHDIIAERIARKEGSKYNNGKGADVKSSRRVIEVATHVGDLSDSIKQLQGYKKPRYLATSSKLIPIAINKTRDTKIGVMGPTGHIWKRAGRTTNKT